MSGGQSALNRRQRYPCKPEGWKPVPAPTPAEHGVRIQSTEYRHRQADLTIEGLIPYASWGNIRIEHNLSQIHSGNDMFGFLHMRKKQYTADPPPSSVLITAGVVEDGMGHCCPYFLF